MINNSIYKITQAIKNFDIASLKELLDDDKTYQDVSKSLFLKKLEKKFNQARRGDCHSFDDVFFGICGSCNKGCEGMTFLSNSGYYLDLFIESKDSKTADDIYVCNMLTNFTGLEKTMDLGFSFGKDEYYNFKPSTKYKLIQGQYENLLREVTAIKNTIKIDDFKGWYSNFNYLSNTIRDFGPFECFGYKLYDKAYDLTSQVECVFEMSLVTEEASEGLIDYQSCFSEREKLIWFFRNRKNHYGSVYYEFPDNWKTNSLINYKRDIVKLTLDISGYEYVMDYFITVDKLYANLMKKYQPLPEHFEASESGSIDHSLENYLRLHNKHLDVIKQYGRKRH